MSRFEAAARIVHKFEFRVVDFAALFDVKRIANLTVPFGESDFAFRESYRIETFRQSVAKHSLSADSYLTSDSRHRAELSNFSVALRPVSAVRRKIFPIANLQNRRG